MKSADWAPIGEAIVKSFDDKARMLEGMAANAALNALTGVPADRERREQEARRYYHEAQVWKQAKDEGIRVGYAAAKVENK